MKIKLIAMALLSATLVASPLLAKDKKKIEPVTMQKRIDQSSPVNLNTDTVENELRNGSNIGSNPLFDEKSSGMATGKRTHKPVNDTEQLENASTKELKFDTTVPTEGQVHRSVEGADNSENRSSASYIKIGDIKGESTKSSSAIPPSITALEVTAPNQIPSSNDSDNSDDEDGDAGATDYNSSRSNKRGIISDIGDGEGDNDEDGDPEATDYNSSRSNKSYSAVDLDENDSDSDSNDEANISNSKKGYDHYAASSQNNAASVADTSSNTTDNDNSEPSSLADANHNTSRSNKTPGGTMNTGDLDSDDEDNDCDAETEKKACAAGEDTCVLTTSVCHF